MFALQGLVLIAAIAAGMNWQTTRHSGKLEEEIIALQAKLKDRDQASGRNHFGHAGGDQKNFQFAELDFQAAYFRNAAQPRAGAHRAEQFAGRIAQSEEQYKENMAARERKLRARQSTMAIVNSGSPLIFSLALFLAAGLFSQGAQKEFPRNRHARNLADYYLYFITAEGLWPNLVLLAFLFVALSGSDYGFDGLFSSVGPLFWVVFWIGFYSLLLHLFVMTARGLYRAMQARPPASEWGFDNRYCSASTTASSLSLPDWKPCFSRCAMRFISCRAARDRPKRAAYLRSE